MSATAKPQKKLTAHDLQRAIEERYVRPEWHLESEVTLGGRRLDIVALNMWGARGYRVVGFELKVDRGDWVRELADFQKSEEWCEVVDAFYVVTPPKLIKDDELPLGWGLLELTGSRMMTRRHADVRIKGHTIPRELAARFLTRLGQKAADAARDAEWRVRTDLRNEIRAQLEKQFEGSRVSEREELARLRKQYSELLAALEVPPQSWDAHRDAMRAAGIFAKAAGDTAHLPRQLASTIEKFEGYIALLKDAAALLAEPLTLNTSEPPSVNSRLTNEDA